MALIQKEQPVAKKEPMGVRVDPLTIKLVHAYAEFIESSPTHVVESIVGYVVERDKAFQAWRLTRAATSPEAVPVVESTETSAAPAPEASRRGMFGGARS